MFGRMQHGAEILRASVRVSADARLLLIAAGCEWDVMLDVDALAALVWGDSLGPKLRADYARHCVDELVSAGLLVRSTDGVWLDTRAIEEAGR